LTVPLQVCPIIPHAIVGRTLSRCRLRGGRWRLLRSEWCDNERRGEGGEWGRKAAPSVGTFGELAHGADR